MTLIILLSTLVCTLAVTLTVVVRLFQTQAQSNLTLNFTCPLGYQAFHTFRLPLNDANYDDDCVFYENSSTVQGCYWAGASHDLTRANCGYFWDTKIVHNDIYDEGMKAVYVSGYRFDNNKDIETAYCCISRKFITGACKPKVILRSSSTATFNTSSKFPITVNPIVRWVDILQHTTTTNSDCVLEICNTSERKATLETTTKIAENLIGWQRFGSFDYKVFQQEPKAFDKAQADCEKSYASLATIKTEEESSFVGDILRKSHLSIRHNETLARYSSYWVGLRNVGSLWRWTDDRSTINTTFMRWSIGNPSGDGLCGELHYIHTVLNDVSCGYTRPFVCKTKPETANYSTYSDPVAATTTLTWTKLTSSVSPELSTFEQLTTEQSESPSEHSVTEEAITLKAETAAAGLSTTDISGPSTAEQPETEEGLPSTEVSTGEEKSTSTEMLIPELSTFEQPTTEHSESTSEQSVTEEAITLKAETAAAGLSTTDISGPSTAEQPETEEGLPSTEVSTGVEKSTSTEMLIPELSTFEQPTTEQSESTSEQSVTEEAITLKAETAAAGGSTRKQQPLNATSKIDNAGKQTPLATTLLSTTEYLYPSSENTTATAITEDYTEDEFRQCQSANGFYAKHSCFFLVSNQTDIVWTDLFSLCKEHSAEPAHMYDMNDLGEHVLSFMLDKFPNTRVWLAAKQAEDSQSYLKLHWMRSADEPVIRVLSNVQNHTVLGPKCMAIQAANTTTDHESHISINYYACSEKIQGIKHALCMRRTKHADFLKVSNMRIVQNNEILNAMAKPTETKNPWLCGLLCRRQGVCLGFNFKRNTNECEVLAVKRIIHK